MKRIVSVFLSVLMLLCCVIPASATGFDSSQEGNIIDVTPYLETTYFDSSSLPSGGVKYLSFVFPDFIFAKYFSMVIRTDDSNPKFATQTSVGGITIEPLGDNLYSVYGTGNSGYRDFFYLEYRKTSGSYLEILSFEVSQADFIVDVLDFSVNMQGTYFYRQYTDPMNDQVFTNISTSFNETDSISGSTYARPPLLQENINTSQYQYNEQSVFVTTYIYFDWTKYDRVDFMLWNGYDSITDCTFYVDGVSVLNNCYPIVSPNSASMVSLDFSGLDPNINSHFCYIRLRGYKELDSKTLKNLIQIPKVSAFVPTVSNNFWPSWLTKIIDKLDNIFTGREQDQAGADSFNDSINEQADELEDLTADLNSVTRPPLSDVNLSTSGMVDQSVVVLSTNGIGSILSNQIILRVLIMSLTFALAGFILFGKR